MLSYAVNLIISNEIAKILFSRLISRLAPSLLLQKIGKGKTEIFRFFRFQLSDRLITDDEAAWGKSNLLGVLP